MSISTCKGDKGETDLFSGERIPKDDLRVETYGTVDELNSWIGFCRQSMKQDDAKERLLLIQRELFSVAGELATKTGVYADPIKENAVEVLTENVKELEEKIPLKGFVIPGVCEASARLDIARTICRRAERAAIRLSRSEEIPQKIIKYLNRLSDLLFMFARNEEENIIEKNDIFIK